MSKRLLILVSGVAVLWGCSEADLDKAKRFFFEVPDDAVAQSEEPQPAQQPDEAPELVLPEGRFVSIHPPVQQQLCTECHDQSQRMQVPEDLTVWCGECHDDFFDDEQVEHPPALDADCLMCHTMHRSEHPSLLVMAAGETCIECHDEAEDLSEDAHGGPGAVNCVTCHDPHFGKSPYLKQGQGAATGQSAARTTDVPGSASTTEDQTDDR